MSTPDRGSLAEGLVVIGEEAVAKSNDGLFYDYYTADYQLHSPAGQFNREEIRALLRCATGELHRLHDQTSASPRRRQLRKRAHRDGRPLRQGVRLHPHRHRPTERPARAMGTDQHLPLYRRRSPRRGVGADRHLRPPTATRRSRELTRASRDQLAAERLSPARRAWPSRLTPFQ